MRFFDRERELALLKRIKRQSESNARLTVVTGRRRIGKTQLVRHALDGVPYVYLYVGRKTEKELCVSFQRSISEVLGVRLVGEATRLEDLLRVVFEESTSRPITMFIDEFQDFFRVNPSVFSALATIWDEYEKKSRLNLIVCGSINRLMNKIFRDRQEPLYGRRTDSLRLEPFTPSVLKEILAEHSPRHAQEDLLALWAFTGGVARYVQRLMDDGATTRDAMIDAIFCEGSSFIDEGLALLSLEFGAEYSTYLSILSSIASGSSEYSQIKNDVGCDVGAFLARLETDYGLIRRKVPLYSKLSSKNSHYEICDSFFRCWFRFVFKYQHLVELGRYEELRKIVRRDYEVFSGYSLEQYFQWKFMETTSYTRMGGWWDRKGENEIDLICEDEFRSTLDFYEIKREPRRINLHALQAKGEVFLHAHPEKCKLKCAFQGLSLEDL